ncbi:MAG: hypothetical protein ACE5GE_15720, partial [Phycisphaerae bacterium]
MMATVFQQDRWGLNAEDPTPINHGHVRTQFGDAIDAIRPTSCVVVGQEVLKNTPAGLVAGVNPARPSPLACCRHLSFSALTAAMPIQCPQKVVLQRAFAFVRLFELKVLRDTIEVEIEPRSRYVDVRQERIGNLGVLSRPRPPLRSITAAGRRPIDGSRCGQSSQPDSPPQFGRLPEGVRHATTRQQENSPAR